MRPLTPHARELLDRLGPLLRPAPTLADRLIRGWHRLRPGADAARWISEKGSSTVGITLEGLMDALARCREPGLVPVLLRHSLRAEPEDRGLVREGLRRLLHRLSCRDLGDLERARRTPGLAGEAAAAGGKAANDGGGALAGEGTWAARLHVLAAQPGGQVFLELGTLHPDGRIRQAALHALGTGAPGGVLGLVLLRVNDPVPAVRQAALATALPYLVAERRDELVAVLPLLLRLLQARRADHRPLVERALALLAPSESGQGTSALIAGLSSFDAEVARASARLLFGAGAHLDVVRVDRLLRDHRNHLRLGAARQLFRLAGDALASGAPDDRVAFERALATATRDRLAGVRAAALSAALRLAGDGRGGEATGGHGRAADLLDEALVDPARVVRQLARAERERRGLLPPAREVYLERLARLAACPPSTREGRRTLIGALHGLGETGQPVDRRVLLGWLEGTPPVPAPVARATLRALGRLDGRGLRPELLAGLRDVRRSVASEAARALARRPSRDPARGPASAARAPSAAEEGALLALVADPAAPAHSVARALRILADSDLWAALPVVLLATADPRVEVAVQAASLWRRRRRGRPGSSRLAAARAALGLLREGSAPAIPPAELEALAGTLAAWQEELGGDGPDQPEDRPDQPD